MEERSEAVEIIRQYVRGEIEEEGLLGVVQRLELDSLCQLPESLDLRCEDFRRIGFRDEDLARLLRAFLAGGLELGAFQNRVRRMVQLFSGAEHRMASAFRPEVAETLSLLSLVLDPSAQLCPRRIYSYLVPVLAALQRHRPMPFAGVLRRVFRDVAEFHFMALSPLDLAPADSFDGLPWADLALLYGAPGAGPHAVSLDTVWFIPLAVTTRRYYSEELPRQLGCQRPHGPWMHPESSKISRLVERHPWLEIDRYRPTYLVDPRGFAELVLDVPELSRGALRFAVKLFALLNGGHGAHLDGESVELYPSTGL